VFEPQATETSEPIALAPGNARVRILLVGQYTSAYSPDENLAAVSLVLICYILKVLAR